MLVSAGVCDPICQCRSKIKLCLQLLSAMHLPKLFRPKRENVRLKFDCSYSRLIHDLQSEKSDITGRQISRLPTESHESSRKIVQHCELYIHVFPWSTNKSWRDEWWSSKRIMIISQKLCEQIDVCQLVFSRIFIIFHGPSCTQQSLGWSNSCDLNVCQTKIKGYWYCAIR